jgi:predicted secreted Zn-dependent protease
MKVLIYCLLLALFPSHYQILESNLIDWHADRKLTWADFQAAPVKDSPNAALTSTMVTVELGYTRDTLTFHIRCQFDKNKSWVSIKNDYILSHEQGHFDIAEIYARRLSRELRKQKIRATNFKKDFDKTYDGIMRQQHAKQLAYDAETNYSINRGRQEEWLKKIEEELKELEPYGNYR